MALKPQMESGLHAEAVGPWGVTAGPLLEALCLQRPERPQPDLPSAQPDLDPGNCSSLGTQPETQGSPGVGAGSRCQCPPLTLGRGLRRLRVSEITPLHSPLLRGALKCLSFPGLLLYWLRLGKRSQLGVT